MFVLHKLWYAEIMATVLSWADPEVRAVREDAFLEAGGGELRLPMIVSAGYAIDYTDKSAASYEPIGGGDIDGTIFGGGDGCGPGFAGDGAYEDDVNPGGFGGESGTPERDGNGCPFLSELSDHGEGLTWHVDIDYLRKYRNGLFEKGELRDGEFAIVVSSCGAYPFFRIGRCHHVFGDEWELQKCRVIKRIGKLATLDALAEHGPTQDTQLLKVSPVEYLHKLHVMRVIPVSREAYQKFIDTPDLSKKRRRVLKDL